MNFIDPSHALEKITSGIRNKIQESGSEGTIIAVSGGLDSAVVTKLSVLAEVDVYGLLMPEEGVTDREDTQDAIELLQELEVDYSILHIGKAAKEIEISFDWDSFPVKDLKLARANIRPRLRMIYCYLAANLDNRLVLGTSNKSELLLGYATKYGDSASDFKPLASLYKLEVYELARHLQIPEKIIQKSPSAGLWKNQTDEAELGASYSKIDPILFKLHEEGLSEEEISSELDCKKELVQGLRKRIEENKHKRFMPSSVPFER